MIAVFSDVHGHALALKKALILFEQLNVDQAIFLGDAIGYLPSWAPVDILTTTPLVSKCLVGNHERMALDANKRAEWGYTREKTAYRHDWLRDAASENHWHRLTEWSSQTGSKLESDGALFVHGSPNDPVNGYLYPDSEPQKFTHPEITANVDFVFCGHSHYPFIRAHNRVTYVNVGSVGLPRDDGRYGSFAIFDPEKRSARIFRFDIQRETSQQLSELAPVARSVEEVFNRRATVLIGDVID